MVTCRPACRTHSRAWNIRRLLASWSAGDGIVGCVVSPAIDGDCWTDGMAAAAVAAAARRGDARLAVPTRGDACPALPLFLFLLLLDAGESIINHVDVRYMYRAVSCCMWYVVVGGRTWLVHDAWAPVQAIMAVNDDVMCLDIPVDGRDLCGNDILYVPVICVVFNRRSRARIVLRHGIERALVAVWRQAGLNGD